MDSKINSENTDKAAENTNTPISGSKSDKQNIIYPTEIQRLFDRLGII